MTLRRVIFWIHLGVGATAAIVILMMSVTGVILTYETIVAPMTTGAAPTRGAPTVKTLETGRATAGRMSAPAHSRCRGPAADARG